MPVSPVPIVVPLLLVGVPLLLALKGQRPFLIAAGVSASLLIAIFLSVFAPGWMLRIRADRDPAAMYELARWTENHDAKLGQLILWPVSPDVLGGYRWLERAVEEEYPPAVYAVGVRLKYGQFVPRPPDWTGPGGNVFQQPEAGDHPDPIALGSVFTRLTKAVRMHGSLTGAASRDSQHRLSPRPWRYYLYADRLAEHVSKGPRLILLPSRQIERELVSVEPAWEWSVIAEYSLPYGAERSQLGVVIQENLNLQINRDHRGRVRPSIGRFEIDVRWVGSGFKDG